MRGRRSYSPRGGYTRSRRGRSPSPNPNPRERVFSRRGGGGGGRDPSTSLLVRNLRHDCRPEDLRRPFAQFGPLKDIYLPRDYYTGAPRGFGFVQYVDPADAADAKYRMDGQIFQGRELTVVFAEENRKKPTEMRSRERTRGSYHDGRRSSARYSRSPPPRHARSRSHSRDAYSPSPKRRQYTRSVSPRDKKVSHGRSYSRESRGRSYSRSPQSPRNSRSRSRSQSNGRSPKQSRSRSQSHGRSPRQSRSRSPYPEDHPKEQSRDPSPSQ